MCHKGFLFLNILSEVSNKKNYLLLWRQRIFEYEQMLSTGLQVRNGKAFEYALAMQYYNYFADGGCNVGIIENKPLVVAQNYYEQFSAEEKNKFDCAAFNTIDTMIKIEPGLVNEKNADDKINIYLNEDQSGENGDVRDVVFRRDVSKWEIGFSAKNNNDAIKHSRIGKNLDFGKAWLNVPCSATYWGEIKPTFDYLEDCISNRYTWSDLKDKNVRVYVPLLSAFRREILQINEHNSKIPEKLVQYLIGNKPFYKIIKDDAHNLVIVKAFNINGELNKQYNKIKSAYTTPKVTLPSRIVEFEFKKDSETTLNMILDGGWEISFRLHNASSLIERSLKFDIKLLGNPPILFTQYIFQ